MEKRNTFYVTTPIYYVTAQPHLGSLYATLLADVVARWNTLQKKDVFFLTGTDEHGQKIAHAAAQAKKNPKEFVDEFIPHYKKVWDLYGIHYDFFIRTTDEYHIAGAQAFIQTLLDKGDIYKSQYTGWYCTPCETFVVEKGDGDADGQTGPLCPSCNRETHIISEETYFFKLSEYTDKLLSLYKENPDFITPKERAQEVISFVESGLKDLSISRTTVPWGVPFPQDSKHTVYVWVEALCNYITAIGYGQKQAAETFAKWWPANIHVLGKDIVRFHGVYWPALLMAADLPLPKKLLVHGWIKVDKQKMSKSFGNVVDPVLLQEKYGAEEVRYYLIRQIPVNQDGDFSTQDLEARIQDDLANDLGNLLNRMSALAEKYNVIDLKSPHVWSKQALDIRDESWNTVADFANYIDDCMFHLALARLWKFIKRVNGYFHGQEPWKKAKTNKDEFLEVLSATCHSLRVIAILLWPVMPKKMEELLASLGVPFDVEQSSINNLSIDSWNKYFMLRKIPVLFTKIETAPSEASTEKKVVSSDAAIEKNDGIITIDDLVKVDLRIGTIVTSALVPNSEKLLQMTVSLGDLGERTILAGIREWYTPEDLAGRRGLFVINLKPRKMAGILSHGMMLVGRGKDNSLHLVSIDKAVSDGTRLQ